MIADFVLAALTWMLALEVGSGPFLLSVWLMRRLYPAERGVDPSLGLSVASLLCLLAAPFLTYWCYTTFGVVWK